MNDLRESAVTLMERMREILQEEDGAAPLVNLYKAGEPLALIMVRPFDGTPDKRRAWAECASLVAVTGADAIVQIADAFISSNPEKNEHGEYTPPSEDPRSREAVTAFVVKADGEMDSGARVYTRNDDGSLTFDEETVWTRQKYGDEIDLSGELTDVFLRALKGGPQIREVYTERFGTPPPITEIAARLSEQGHMIVLFMDPETL